MINKNNNANIASCIRYIPVVNTLMPRQNGRYFPDGIFKHIFLNDNVGISINFTEICSLGSNWQ